MPKILVTGGGGYIGSHTIVDLVEHGFEVISADNHLRSEPIVFEQLAAILHRPIQNYAIELCNLAATLTIFEEHPDIVGVVHFAALKSVPESIAQPIYYYQNNINSLSNVLSGVLQYKIPYFIFSSSCSVYGNTQELPVVETTPLGKTECPYAYTKQVGEQLVRDTVQAAQHPLQAILLRYFNPAGAHPSALLGEMPPPSAPVPNVVPILMETALGIRSNFTVMGNDYPTRDGSCIRDYIHVMDLANAHTKCIEFLQKENPEKVCEIFNVGIGQGVTVIEAIQALERVIQQKIPYTLGNRRAGDVAAIYANYEKAARLLGWQPQYSIDDIMRTAWAWELKRRNIHL